MKNRKKAQPFLINPFKRETIAWKLPTQKIFQIQNVALRSHSLMGPFVVVGRWMFRKMPRKGINNRHALFEIIITKSRRKKTTTSGKENTNRLQIRRDGERAQYGNWIIIYCKCGFNVPLPTFITFLC